MHPSQATRIEVDLLGEVEVPADALHGAQTQRAVANFPLGHERPLGSYPDLIIGLLQVKQTAAEANLQTGLLDPVIATPIVQSARTLIEQGAGNLFPVHRLHGGGGTSANMNANEVLANMAEELLGGRRGEYHRVHPNDHVNLHQSTNDVYPTACHIAVVRTWPGLQKAVAGLATSLRDFGQEAGGTPRLARTCLQDAVESSFADLFGGYATNLERGIGRVETAVDALHAVNLGGTAIGRADGVPAPYFDTVITTLRDVTGDSEYRRADDLFDAAQNPDDLAAVAAALDLLAQGLRKIAQDLRLLSSGPEGGLGELGLPPVQPGSSIMPGKVNPVIPEFAIHLCLQAAGHHSVCRAALGLGELDLNVWESALTFNLLDSMGLLAQAASSLDVRCAQGLTVDIAQNRQHANSLVPLLSQLARTHGYTTVAAVCREAGNDPSRTRELLRLRGIG
jgi:aspartate ammonia-lyase